MKLLTAGIIVLATLLPATSAMGQAAQDTYGGSGQVPATVTPTVLGVEESGGGTVGTTVEGVQGVAGETGVAGVQGSAPASGGGGSLPTAAATPSEAVPSGSLPFTGLDLALIALGGITLLGLGLMMRRLGRAVPGA